MWRHAILQLYLVLAMTVRQVCNAPVITSIRPSNMPAVGGGDTTFLVIGGSNFGFTTSNIMVGIGTSFSSEVSNAVDSLVICKIPAGTGAGLDVFVNVSGAVTTLLKSFSYDPPIVTSLNPNNVPTAGSTSRVLGKNFGVANVSPVIQMAGVSLQSSWTSDSSVQIVVPPGAGGMKSLSIGVSNQVYTAVNALSYSAPATNQEGVKAAATSFYAPALGAFQKDPLSTTITTLLNLDGSSFGMFDFTMQARIGRSAGVSTRWSSETSCVVLSSRGVGGALLVVASVARQSGTSSSALTYVSPKLSAVSPVVGSPLGGFVLSLTGSSFGSDDYSPLVLVGMSTCQTYFVSDSSTRVVVKSGVGANLAVSISSQGQVGIWNNFFSYQAPNVTSISPANSPTAGSLQISILGSNFGSSSQPDQNIVIGKTSCTLTLWKSDSSMTCVTPRGTRSGLDVSVRSGGLVGTFTAGFSFDRPVIESVFPGVTATAGGQSITVIGKNFGIFGSSQVTVKVGYTTCSSSAYGLNEYMLICVLAPGAGIMLPVYVALDGGSFTGQVNAFSYSPPTLQAVNPSILLPAGRLKLTLSGQGFGTGSDSQSAAVQSTVSRTTFWISDSSLPFLYAAGVGSGQSVSVSVGDQRHSLKNIASFSIPLLSSTQPSNVPSLLPTVGIAGQCFVAFDTSGAVRVQGQMNGRGSASMTSQWTSDSSLLCKLSSGAGVLISVQVTISSFFNSISSSLSFDLAKVKSGADYTPSLRIGQTACWSNVWNSDTNLVCGVPAGLVAERVIVTILNTVGSSADALSFDLQTVTSSSRYNLRSDVVNSLTLLGASFGMEEQFLAYMPCASRSCSLSSAFSFNPINLLQSQNRLESITTYFYAVGLAYEDHSLALRVGVTSAQQTAWRSYTAMQVKVSSSVGREVRLIASASSVLATSSSSNEFTLPLASSTSPSNSPPAGVSLIAFLGTSYGSTSYSQSVRVGPSESVRTIWTSASSIASIPSFSMSNAMNVVITSGLQAGTAFRFFSFDAISISSVHVQNIPNSGNRLVSFSGSSYGSSSYTLRPSLSFSVLQTASWTSDTAIVCKVIAGVGNKLPFAVAQGSAYTNTGTISDVISFDSPQLSGSSKQNMPQIAPSLVTIFSSVGFGSADYSSILVLLNGKQVLSSLWTSDSSITCQLAPGEGEGLNFAVQFQNEISFVTQMFTFDAPAVSAALRSNLASNRHFSILGYNFGVVDLSIKVCVGTLSQKTIWQSVTSLVAIAEQRARTSVSLIVTTWQREGTLSSSVSYAVPVLSTLYAGNGPVVTLNPLVLFESSTSSTPLSESMRIGFTACERTLWISGTQIAGKVSSGVSKSAGIVVTYCLSSNSLSHAYSYDLSAQVDRVNIPVAGAMIVSFPLLTFQPLCYTPTVRMVSALQSTRWSSTSSISCSVRMLPGRTLSVQVTIGRSIVTVTEATSFDTSAMSSISTTNSFSRGQTLYIYSKPLSLNLESTLALRIGPSKVLETLWLSSTSLSGRAAFAYARSQSLSLSVASLQSSTSQVFSYDSVQLSSAIRGNIFSTGVIAINFRALAIEVFSLTASVRVASTVSSRSMWTSDSAVQALVSSGVGGSLSQMLTVVLQVSSLSQLLSYDRPTLASRPANSPTTGNVDLQLSGAGLGNFDACPVAQVERFVCRASMWKSDSSMVCRVNEGAGAGLDISVKVKEQVGTLSSAVSFDTGIILAVSQANFPSSGNSIVSLIGVNLGAFSMTSYARVGGTACQYTVFQSQSQIWCKVAAGVDQNMQTLVSVAFQQSQALAQTLSYDIGSASSQGLVSSTTGNNVVETVGAYLGTYDSSVRSRVSQTEMQATRWVSDTCLQGICPAGEGRGLRLVISIGARHSTMSESISFASVVFVDKGLNFVVSVTSYLAAGHSFAPFDTTSQVRLQHTASVPTHWFSDSSLSCLLPYTTGGGKKMIMTIHGNTETSRDFISFDLPVFSVTQVVNLRATRSNFFVTGKGFPMYDLSVSASISGSSGEVTIWTSATTVHGIFSGQTLASGSISLTMSGIKATVSEAFSMDVLKISSIARLNYGPQMFGDMLIGTSLSRTTFSPATRIGGTSMPVSKWISSSVLTCRATPMERRSLSVSFTTNGAATSITESLSFEQSFLTSTLQQNLDVRGNSYLVIFGAFSEHSMKTRVASSACRSTVWQSDSVVNCNFVIQTPRSMASIISAALSSIHSITNSLSYDSFVLDSYLSSQNNVINLNSISVPFGLIAQATVRLRMGFSNAESSVWRSATSLEIKSVIENGRSLALCLTSSSLYTSTNTHTFDLYVSFQSVISSSNFPILAATKIIGKGFALSDKSIGSRISSTSSASTNWISDSSVTSTYTSYAFRTFSTVITMSAVTNTLSQALTMDAPIIDGIALSSTNIVKQKSIQLLSLAYMDDVRSASVRVGSTSSLSTAWNSSSYVFCKIAAGAGHSKGIYLSIHSLVSSASSAVSYDTLAISSGLNQTRSTANTRGVLLSQLLPPDSLQVVSSYSASTRIGRTSCESTGWISTSEVRVQAHAHGRQSMSLSITCGRGASTVSELLTYSAVTVSSVQSVNAGSRSTFLIASLSRVSSSAAGRVGSTGCEISTWLSVTSVSCICARGRSQLGTQAVALTISQATGSVSGSVSFDTQQITGAERGNRYMGMVRSVIVGAVGAVGGAASVSASLRQGSTACERSLWISGSSLAGRTASGQAGSMRVVASVAGQPASTSRAASYDVPMTSEALRTNVGGQGGAKSVQVWGQGYGPSASASVGRSSCERSGWLSDTAIQGTTSGEGYGGTRGVIVSSGRQVGTRSASVSYDAERLLSLIFSGNSFFPGQGNLMLPLKTFIRFSSSSNFNKVSLGIRTGFTVSSRSMWTSDSAVQALVSSGVGGSLSQMLTVVLQVSSLSQLLSYDRPTLASRPANSPTTGNVDLQLSGAGLGNFDACPVAQVERFVCRASMWKSDSSMVCRVNEGAGAGLDISVKVKEQVGTLSQVFSYDGPAVFRAIPSFSDTVGNSIIFVEGLNFGWIHSTNRFHRITSESTGNGCSRQHNCQSCVIRAFYFIIYGLFIEGQDGSDVFTDDPLEFV
ncbi:hypothetical protein GUITHDRAFT_99619 [Guillardia theta CCMP2712]|uniref:IPT/TIG domain-containing protein n=1 Tax=Guillardia theta (strain CCMP2712) TaxID=905079 RepID=L1K3N4_GUITC|nr:hypothetical protein GUITHDRAFT_99619 [Guillardia theta CCMP2712]EKX54973.1 hypothetical protein GUITHDRAFT_99619 [Guillardia theta CCMP2712]|eukprot:XP_005841953.1 hypothetical protein GUITHDRAFT_99619 [Guillardia theta CCMP2712]